MKRLDDAVIYDGPEFALMLVRYFENLPFHFSGEIASVQCSSENTRDYLAQRGNDAGWRPLGRIPALGSKTAAELKPVALQAYFVIDDRILVWTSRVFKISFDGCGVFAMWDPTKLSSDKIDPVEKPAYCAPEGTADCRTYDFDGDRAPVYSDIQARMDGFVSFTVQSIAFRPLSTIRIRSENFGITWQIVEITGASLTPL